MKTKARIRTAVLCLLILAMLLPGRVMASAGIDSARDSSLTINFHDGDTPIAGADFDLYLVAEMNEQGDYELVDDFRRVSVNLEDLDSDALLELASTLTAYIDLFRIQPVRSGSTDEQGLLKFEGLQPGLYLVRGYAHEQDGKIYTSVPFLVYLPWYDAAAGEWIYDLELSPKFESEPDEPDEEPVKIKVLKVWKDDGNEAERPDEIIVHLLCDGEIYDTVILSEENNWRYTWENLPGGHIWTVVEEVPDGYTVIITRQGITFVITNSKPDDDNPPPSPPPTPTPPVTPPPTTPPDEPTPTPTPGEPTPTPTPTPPVGPPDLPQTGQLWWPVALLAGAGIILFLIGFIRNRGASDET